MNNSRAGTGTWRLGAITILLAACSADPTTTSGSTSSAGGASTSGTGAGGESSCPAGHAECDGDPKTLCETPTDIAVDACGACASPCPAGGPNQQPTCVDSQCGLSCATGFEDCDRDPSNGCELTSGQCSVQTLVTGVDSAMGLAVDDEYVYYGSKGIVGDFTKGSIWRTKKDGSSSTPELLAEAQNRPINLAIDDTHVYWANGGNPPATDGSIVRAPKSGGGGAFHVLAEGMVRPSNPVVVGDTIYWTIEKVDGSVPPTGGIQSSPKDGDGAGGLGVVTTIVGDLHDPRDLQFHGGALYWATVGEGLDPPVIARKFLPDGMVQTLSNDVPDPSYDIAIDDQNVYAGSFLDKSLLKIPLSGGKTQTLVSDFGAAQELVVDGPFVYFTTGPGNAVLKTPIGGGTTALVANGGGYTSYLTQDADFLYWTDGPLSKPGGSIKRAPK